MKILIIKISAMGDVLRTTALLHGIKRAWPDPEVWWLTSGEAVELLKENNYINNLLEFNKKNSEFLKTTTFDMLISLDKERDVILLADKISADRKIGFGCDASEELSYFNKESEYAYRLGISDELKFRINKKSYPEIIYGMCGLGYEKDRYILNLRDAELEGARHKLECMGIKHTDFTLGLNTGAGPRFANKIWSFEKHKALIEEILKNRDIKIILLGGKREEALNQKLKNAFKERVYDSGSDSSLRGLASIISHCSIIISGDTLAMHIAIALNKYTVSIFGPTCSQEIELYGNGRKIVSDIECSPCYKMVCAKKDNCMSKIKILEVLDVFKPVRLRRTGLNKARGEG